MHSGSCQISSKQVIFPAARHAESAFSCPDLPDAPSGGVFIRFARDMADLTLRRCPGCRHTMTHIVCCSVEQPFFAPPNRMNATYRFILLLPTRRYPRRRQEYHAHCRQNRSGEQEEVRRARGATNECLSPPDARTSLYSDLFPCQRAFISDALHLHAFFGAMLPLPFIRVPESFVRFFHIFRCSAACCTRTPATTFPPTSSL